MEFCHYIFNNGAHSLFKRTISIRTRKRTILSFKKIEQILKFTGSYKKTSLSTEGSKLIFVM